ncbi:MAG: hypothetical protein H0T46_08350 [Deltaproteobacteria bacterium]|nr:hypothetical protein [Deltaproteobacteria bacterium]
MYRRTLVWVVLVAVAACGGKKENDKDGKSGGAAGEKSADVSTLFTGTTVTLPAEVAAATFGAPQADVNKALGADSTYITSKTHDSVSYDLDYTREEKKLEKVSVSANKAELEPILTKQWGPPIKNKKGEAFWFNEKDGLRAWLPDHGKGKRLAFSKYDSLTALFGPKGFDLAFAENKPLVGATLDELHKAWGGKLCDFDKEGENVKKSIEEYRTDWNGLWHDKKKTLRLCLAQPRTIEQYTPLGDTIYFGRMGRVEEVIFSFQTGGSVDLTKQMVAFFDAKLGKPTELATSNAAERWYFEPATKRRAVVSVSLEHVTLAVSRYTPIAEVLAADTPGVISLVTKSMPGGTPEQIQKEDPDHFNPHGTLPELVFPGTDWSRHEVEVDLAMWDKAKTTHGYSVVFHHTNNEAAGDEVFKLLEAKLGPAKKDSKWTEKDQYYNFKTKQGHGVETRRSSQQWWIRVTK